MCTEPTDKPDDVEGGVGEYRCIGLIKIVVGLLLASHSLFGDTDACKKRKPMKEETH